MRYTSVGGAASASRVSRLGSDWGRLRYHRWLCSWAPGRSRCGLIAGRRFGSIAFFLVPLISSDIARALLGAIELTWPLWLELVKLGMLQQLSQWRRRAKPHRWHWHCAWLRMQHNALPARHGLDPGHDETASSHEAKWRRHFPISLTWWRMTLWETSAGCHPSRWLGRWYIYI